MPRSLRCTTLLIAGLLIAGPLIASIACVVTVSAYAAAPGQLARCSELYGVWWTYEQDPVFFHTGERAQAEFAVYECQQGNSTEGVRDLKDLMRHGRFTFPEEQRATAPAPSK